MTKKLDSPYYVLSMSRPFSNDPMFCGYFRPPPQTKIKAIPTEDGTSDSCTKSVLCPGAAGEGLCVVTMK